VVAIQYFIFVVAKILKVSTEICEQIKE